MFPKPRTDLAANTADFERLPYVTPNGFREYDARWVFERDINLMGIQALGLGLGTQLHEMGLPLTIAVGHDYRSYSGSIKYALISGLMAAGCKVHDIGLALSPMAYFAQFDLGTSAVAMVTASHNENGWTGVKMGASAPLTHGPDEMSQLKEIVLGGAFRLADGGAYVFEPGVHDRYIADLVGDTKLKNPLKIVAACGNGTAGEFGPRALEAIGATVIPLDAELDHSFPRYNPNPEDMTMLHALAEAVREHDADVGMAFDGDGDRCGIVDDTGAEIFADKVGLIMARSLAKQHPGSTFVVDVKSTGLFMTDPVLKEHKITTDYWKTGHRHMKRRVNALGALAGFEKSGHYFLNAPIGRGYDDGILTAIRLCEMLDAEPGKKFSDLKAELGHTYSSPTMAPYCADERKYEVIADITKQYEAMVEKGETILGQKIAELITVNGVRFHLEDGSWGLVRASSNKPSLVVVVESPTSEELMKQIFEEIDARLQATGEVGEYDQRL